MRHLIAALRNPDAYEWRTLRPWRRHSLVLVVAGAVYVSYGVATVLAADNPARDQALRVPLHWFPLWVWGLLFVLTGLAAFLSARWPPASETWGYSSLSGLSSLWAMFYLAGALLGTPSAIPGALIWALMAFLWVMIAGLHNPEDIAVEDDA